MKNEMSGSVYLSAKIKMLEEKEEEQRALLKYYADEMRRNMMPATLLKGAVSEIAHSKDFRKNILDTSLSIGAGILAKKLYVQGSKNIFKKLAGMLLQAVTTGLVGKRMPGIRQKISTLQEH